MANGTIALTVERSTILLEPESGPTILLEPEEGPAITLAPEAAPVIVLEPVVGAAIVLTGEGVQGPKGDPGPAGASFLHVQAAPAPVWTINHNLGFRPTVSLFTVGGAAFDAELVHVSTNQVHVLLNTPAAGTARCT